MKVISILNSKGGVGKTTITANLGAQLAKLGYYTLLIDTDPQSNLTFSFLDDEIYHKKYLRTNTIYNSFDTYIVHNRTTPLRQLIIKPDKINQEVNDNLDLLCSHVELNDIMNNLMTVHNKKKTFHLSELNLQSILRTAVKQLKNKYDFILIDCSPGLNLMTQNAIVASDYYTIPVKLDFLSTDGLFQLTQQIKKLKTNYNRSALNDQFRRHNCIDPKLLGVVTNMVNMRNNELISTQQEYLNKIANHFPVFDTKLRLNSSYYKAPQTLMPVVINNGDKKIQEELIALTDEILEKVGLK
ncbi:ParA family protein [Haloplasma contractile]|uniref:SoJ Protein n=1 Tax=Haloplasma contractile SSD-17B TaxID=1033810 RepID=U2FKD2_9MOLU|nr:AAA family ATPase [Haloplasma contractile]ERJ13270.1 soJ Protein [Haloplasma contractile SSD-17B]